MKMYSYVVVNDTGFAPNPFHDVLTLALCTPNHQRILAGKGDWIVGNATKARGPKLVYAMRVCERMGLNQYFHDPRFAAKKPSNTGNWRDWPLAVGDNLYYRDESGKWRQIETQFHCDADSFSKDTFGDTVFIADEFYYFGETLPLVPQPFRNVLHQSRGCATVESAAASDFLKWLRGTHQPGVHGKPSDWRDVAQKL